MHKFKVCLYSKTEGVYSKTALNVEFRSSPNKIHSRPVELPKIPLRELSHAA